MVMEVVIARSRIVATLTVSLLALFLAAACSPSHCGYTKIPVTSPDRNFQAEIQNWTCRSEMAIGKPDKQAIVRLIDVQNDGLSEGVFSIAGKHVVTAQWIDATHLEIKCEDVQGNTIEKKLESWNGITISYVLR